ncbi:ASCH domain-containing protein [Nanoarchaeota archaeon]
MKVTNLFKTIKIFSLMVLKKMLKFADPLPEMIMDGSKDTTWRIDDDKNISIDDHLSCCYVNGKEFAQAYVEWVKMTRFGLLTDDDKEGHEPFDSDEEMYATYSRYYNKEVTPSTKLKVVRYNKI